MTTSKSENSEPRPKAAVFRVIVNLIAEYGDTSHLQTRAPWRITKRVRRPRPSTEVIANALAQSAEWYEAIRTAKTKKPPALYVMPLALQAFYPDKREAISL